MILIALIGLVALFVLDVGVGIRRGFGFRHYWFFELLHVLGGFFLALLLSGFVGVRGTVMGILAGTILWEGLEWMLARLRLGGLLRRKWHLPKKPYSWSDTVLDIVLNYAGAFLLLWLRH